MSRYMGTVRYTGTVTSPHPPADVWRYLADLRSLAEWDPSVKQIRLVSGEPGASGTRYELEVGVLGRRLALPYRLGGRAEQGLRGRLNEPVVPRVLEEIAA